MQQSNIIAPPNEAYCNELAKTGKTFFTGDIELSDAFFLENRTLRELVLYDLDIFESNPDSNFVICTNSNVNLYKEYIKIFNLNVKLYTSDEVKPSENFIVHDDILSLNDRWCMKHRSLITSPFTFEKIALFTQETFTDHSVYRYDDVRRWSEEGFVFINTSTTPLADLINIIAGADKIACASELEYFYALYCKQGSTLYYISRKDEPGYLQYNSTVNRHYKNNLPLCNIINLPAYDTITSYRNITSDV